MIINQQNNNNNNNDNKSTQNDDDDNNLSMSAEPLQLFPESSAPLQPRQGLRLRLPGAPPRLLPHNLRGHQQDPRRRLQGVALPRQWLEQVLHPAQQDLRRESHFGGSSVVRWVSGQWGQFGGTMVNFDLAGGGNDCRVGIWMCVKRDFFEKLELE